MSLSPPNLFWQCEDSVLWQRVKPFGQAFGLFIGMDSLQVLREHGGHKFQGLGRTNLHTLGPPLAILFAQIADQSEIVVRGIKARNIGGTGLPALPASRTQTALLINDHVANFLVIVYYRRVHWTRFLTLALPLRTLRADVLD